MNIVEITIDLDNANQKPIIEVFKVNKEIKDGYMARQNNDEKGRRFLISCLDHVAYRNPMRYSYRYITEENDYDKIYSSEKTKSAMLELQIKLQDEITYCQKQLKGVVAYYEDAIK